MQERSREVNRVQGVLERANMKLAAVGSDMMGVSGRAILTVLIEGRTDPATMAALAKGRLRRKIPLLEQALTGLVRDHHRRMLAIPLAHSDFLDEPIEVLSAEMTRCLTEWVAVRNGLLWPMRVVMVLLRGELLAAICQGVAHGRRQRPEGQRPQQL